MALSECGDWFAKVEATFREENFSWKDLATGGKAFLVVRDRNTSFIPMNLIHRPTTKISHKHSLSYVRSILSSAVSNLPTSENEARTSMIMKTGIRRPRTRTMFPRFVKSEL